MVKAGFLPAKFQKLNNKAPPCVLCLIGQAHRKPWHFKCTKYEVSISIRPEKVTEPGSIIGNENLISAQPDLVP